MTPLWFGASSTFSVAKATSLATVHLREGRERPLRREHPWVLSGSVDHVEGDPESGDVVRVAGAHGERLGVGDYDPDSQIRVRMHGFGPTDADPDEDWLLARIEPALACRATHPALRDTAAIRPIHADGDGLPGLRADPHTG